MRHSTVLPFTVLMVGKTLGKYRIIEKIGRGGMGVVYRGVDETLDRQVAIKAISPELVEDDLVRRFRAEAVTLAKVNHQNIATVYELFRDEDRLLMVMELVSGQTFEQLIEQTGPMSVERAASLTGQILDALGHAHRAGIVHRDLKPANLMLTDAGIVKVMDFGIARVSGTERMTSDGFMVGTPAYMAPEQVRGEDVDGRTDLYAVGVVFYRLLTGKLPFKAETAVAMIHSQLNDQPTPARQVRADLPEWLESTLMRALAKRPGDRFQTADEFRAALHDVAPLSDDVTMATPSAPMLVREIGAPPPAVAATPAGPHPTTTVVLNRSHLAVAGGFGVMLLTVIGLLAWLALRPPAVPVQIVTAPAATVVPAPPAAPPAASSAAPVVASPAVPPATPPAKAAPKPSPASASSPAAQLPVATVTPPSADALPAMRGGRGGRGLRGGAQVLPDGEFKPVVLRDLHAMAVIDGRGSRLVDVIMAFSEKSITASDSRNGFTVKTFPYAAVRHTTLSRGRKPRGTNGADVEVPGGVPEGNIFARGPRLWLTIQTADDQLILRLDPEQVRPVLDVLVPRIKMPVERFMEPQ